jgi:hypothetical protein
VNRPAPVASSSLEPFPACPHFLPNLRGRYVPGPAPLDFTGATAAVLCAYVATPDYDYVFKRRLPIRASVLPRVITALNHSGPFDLRLADCLRGAPKAGALYLREATGNIDLMTVGGGGCGPLMAMGLSLHGSGLLAALELAGY